MTKQKIKSLKPFSTAAWEAQQRYEQSEKGKERQSRYKNKPEVKRQIKERAKAWYEALMADPERKAEHYKKLAANRKSAEYRQKHREYMAEYRQRRKTKPDKPPEVITPAQIAANPYLIFKQARLEKRISVIKLAEQVGVSRAYVYLIEAGKHKPSPEILTKLAAVLGVDLSVLSSD
jgi:DNA-binding XRE family transcriptional regulator